jgi:hypothetical protein
MEFSRILIHHKFYLCHAQYSAYFLKIGFAFIDVNIMDWYFYFNNQNSLHPIQNWNPSKRIDSNDLGTDEIMMDPLQKLIKKDLVNQ